MPSARFNTACGVIGNTVYIAGGHDATGTLCTLEAMRVPVAGDQAP